MRTTTQSGGRTLRRRSGVFALAASLVASSAAIVATATPAHAATTTLVVDSLEHAVGDWSTPGQRTLYAALEEANAIPANPGDDIEIVFDDSLSGTIDVTTGAQINTRMVNGAIGVRPDVLGSGAFLHVDAEQPVTIDFGGDIGFQHTTDAGYAGLLIGSDDVTVTGFTNFRAGEAGIVVDENVAGATISNGVIDDSTTNWLEVGIGLTDGVTDVTIENVDIVASFRHGIFIDQNAVVDGVAISGLDVSDTREWADITAWQGSTLRNVTVSNSSFNSPNAVANIVFGTSTETENMTVSDSTFTGHNDRAHLFVYPGASTTGLAVVDNEFTEGRFVWEDSGGNPGIHTDLRFEGNTFEQMRSHVLAMNQSRYTGVRIVNNDFNDIFNGATATVWVGIRAGTVLDATEDDNLIHQNRFIQSEDFLADNPSATNKWAVFNDARAANATSPTGWTITENHVDGYVGNTQAPISNVDIGYNTVFGNTFGPRTRGSLNPGDTEAGSRWFVWNESGLANRKIQTWRVQDGSTTFDEVAGTVTVTAESVAPLPGNNAETEPVEIHAYWTADEHAEVYLGQFSGGPHTGSATDTFAHTGGVGTVRVQIIDSDGNSSQYSGAADGELEPDFSFLGQCETEGRVFISQNNPTQLFTAVQGESGVTFEEEGPASGVLYNALAYRASDGYLYAIRGDDNLLRIGQGGVITDLGPVTGLPAANYNQGTFGTGEDADTYYVRGAGNGDPVVIIDVDTQTATTLATSAAVPNVSDIVYLEGFLWGQVGNTMWRINPVTGAVNSFNTGLGLAGDFGGQWTYGNGDIGLSRNDTGTVYRIRVTDAASAAPGFALVFSTSGPPSGNNDAAACIGPEADLEITKEGPGTYVTGDDITYTLTVTNNGPGDSSGFMVTDPIPAGLGAAATDTPGCSIVDGQLDCIFGPLANGGTQEIVLTGTATGTELLENVATVIGNDPDPDLDNNTATTTAAPNLGEDIVAPDTCLSPFVETFGQGTGWGGQLPAGVTTYTYQGNFPNFVTNDGEYSIVSDATIAGGFWHSGGDATGDTNGRFMLINADEDASGAFYRRSVTGLVPGQRYVLSAAITNANAVFSPILPNVQLRIIDADSDVIGSRDTGPIANQAEMIWTEYGLVFEATTADAVLEVANLGLGGTGNDLALDDITLAQACPELTLVKSAAITDDQGAPDLADEGDEITYTFTVTNTGNTPIDDVVVNDPRPGLSAIAPASVDTLEPGAEQVFTATYTVTAADAASGEIANTATASGDGPLGPVVSEPDTATVPTAVVSLGLVKTAQLNDTNGNGTADAGETIAYTFVVTNTGNVTVNDINVVDPRVTGLTPAGFSLDPGESQTVTADPYVVTAADVAGGPIVNTASATGTGPAGVVGASAPSTATVASTSLVAPKAQPRIKTKAPKRVRLTRTANGQVRAGLRDTIRIRGFRPGGNAKGRAVLYGPFTSRGAARCTPANRVGAVAFTPRNGRFRSKVVRVNRPGVYTWVVRTSADANNEAASHRCGLRAETTRVLPPRRVGGVGSLPGAPNTGARQAGGPFRV